MLTINDVTFALNQLAGYKVYRQESGATSFFQYLNKEGDFYFMKSVVSGALTTFTFGKKSSQTTGNQDIDTSWTNRASLAYQRFDQEFR